MCRKRTLGEVAGKRIVCDENFTCLAILAPADNISKFGAVPKDFSRDTYLSCRYSRDTYLSWGITSDLVRVLLIRINFCRSNAPFGILEIQSFPQISPKWSDILSWKFSYDFVQYTIDQVRVPSLCIRLALCPSFHFLRFPPTCTDKCSWNLKFEVGFLNAFLLEKYYIKIAFKNVHDGRIMHCLRCSFIFWLSDVSQQSTTYLVTISSYVFEVLYTEWK